MNELKRIKDTYEVLAHKVGDKCGLGELNYAEKQDFEIIEKRLKALEVIDNKNVDIGYLKRTNTLIEYNGVIGTSTHNSLSQQEYDLLKEVLLND